MNDSLDLLFEATGLPHFELPAGLVNLYGGPLGFSTARVYANFVESLDGVTALPGVPESGRLIAGGSEQDRFVMGLLRACADAVLIGAGTLHGSPHTHWTAENAYPPAADLYAELRARRGSTPHPTLAVVTGSGRLDPQHPGLSEPAIVLTSEKGASTLRGRLPESARIAAIGTGPSIDPAAILRTLRDRGYRLILCEGGPTLFGALLEVNLVDELFVTISPRLAGRLPDSPRLSLVENVELLPHRTSSAALLSVRRSEAHLFLRYQLNSEAFTP